MNFILRPWQRGDEDSLCKYANNYNIWRNLRDTFPYPYTWQDAEQWINIANNQNPTHNLAIVVDGAAVGGIGITIHQGNYRHNAEIGYWLAEPFWGQGIVTEALRQMTDYTFYHFEVHRIEAHVYEYNPSSARVLVKNGYQYEGTMRKSVMKEGILYDAYLYAKLREF